MLESPQASKLLIFGPFYIQLCLFCPINYLFILLEVWFLAQPLWKRFAPKSLLPVVFNLFLQGPVQPGFLSYPVLAKEQGIPGKRRSLPGRAEKWLKASTEEFPPAFINPQTVRCCRCDFMQQDPHYHKTASTGVNSARTLQTAWIPEDQARTCPHNRGDPEEKQEKRNKRYWCHYVTSLWALKLVITQTHLHRLKKKKKNLWKQGDGVNNYTVQNRSGPSLPTLLLCTSMKFVCWG